MTFNYNEKYGKYICIHCKENFHKIPIFKSNECPCGYNHYIVEKKKLEKIIINRDKK